jgi:peptide/nickel transport system substrate-binding protein
MRLSVKLVWLALILLVTVSCAPPAAAPADSSAASAPAAESKTDPSTIVVAVANDPTTWDYDFVQGDLVGLSLVKNVDPFLIDHPTVDSGQGYWTLDTTQIVGIYADSYTVSDDGLVWTIKLKEGMQFPNGDPVNAEAFRWSKERGLAHKANIGFVYSTIGISSPDHVKAIDDYTLEITHDKFTSLQPYMHVIGSFFFNPLEVQKHVADGEPWATDWKSKNPGEGGPYTVAEQIAGQRVVLVKNPNWPGEVKNERVEVQVVPSSANQLLMLKSGDIDIAYGLSRKEVLSLADTAGVKILSIPTTDATVLVLNHTMAPFDNADFRKAIAYALPYGDIISGVYGGNATAMKSVIPNGMPGHTDKHWGYDTNLDKAKEALAASGITDAKVELYVEAGVAEHEQIALLVQNALQQIGVTVEIKPLDSTTIAEQRAKRALPFLVHQGIAWINDPEYHFNLSLMPDGFLNFGGYNNARIVEIVTQSSALVNADERFAAYDEAQQIAMDELPFIPLAQPNYVVAMRDNLEGYTYANDQVYRFWTMYKK